LPNFSKSSLKSLQTSKKCQNVSFKAQTESPKYLHQTTFERQCFGCAYLIEIVIDLLKPKMAQNVAINLGYYILSKNHSEPSKVAQLAKNYPIWSPCLQS
jgi:hypothetical protein